MILRLVLFVLISLNLGCASLGGFIKKMAGSQQEAPLQQNPNTFSSNKNANVFPLPERSYGRMNRSSFEQQAGIEGNQGSLWVMEGQTSYLFSQNQKRLEGDVLNIVLEDQAKQQLSSKVDTIASLMQRRQQSMEPQRAIASEGEGAAQARSPREEAKSNFNVEQVPSRVIATYPDGSFRVRGVKTIMIESREFQVLVTGLVRGNDIINDKVASGKLLDSRLDVTSERRLQ